MNPLAIKLAGIAIASTIGFAGGWSVNGWRHDSMEVKAIKEANEAKDKAIAERDELTKKLAITDDSHRKLLESANNETNRLRDCLRTGTCGLRIKATCKPKSTGGTSPGMDSGASAELDPLAGSAYFALRDGINKVTAQLGACQDQLRERVR